MELEPQFSEKRLDNYLKYDFNARVKRTGRVTHAGLNGMMNNLADELGANEEEIRRSLNRLLNRKEIDVNFIV